MRVATLIIPIFLLSSALYAENTGNSFHVLCYHAFIPSKNRYCFSLEELEAHIKTLEKKGFRFVSLSDIRSGHFSGERNVLISIDDGNRSAWNAYYRVLKKHSIRPVLAIYPSVIGRRKYALTWEQLAGLSRDGCDIAAHGYCHLCLKDKLYRSDKKSFKREIFLSKNLLEKRLHKKIDVFVYPYGATSGPALRFLREAGYVCAFTVQKGGMSGHERAVDGCLEIPRYCMTRDSSHKNLELVAANYLYHGRNKDKPLARIKSPLPEKKHAPGPAPVFKAASRFIINRISNLSAVTDPRPVPDPETRPGKLVRPHGYSGPAGLFHPAAAMAYSPHQNKPAERGFPYQPAFACTAGVKAGSLSAVGLCSSAYSSFLDLTRQRVSKTGRALKEFFSRDAGRVSAPGRSGN